MKQIIVTLEGLKSRIQYKDWKKEKELTEIKINHLLALSESMFNSSDSYYMSASRFSIGSPRYWRYQSRAINRRSMAINDLESAEKLLNDFYNSCPSQYKIS